jgi:undecaprenyl-diphosphatase
MVPMNEPADFEGGAAAPVRRVLKLDETLLLFVRRWHVPRVARLMRAFTRMGDASTWTLSSLALIAAGGPASRYGRLMGYSALLATLLAQALKRVCRRRRPSSGIHGFTALADNPDAFSFPSGHTTVAFAAAIALAGQGPWLGPLYFGLAFAIGLSRVYLGAHYPLDVGVGALLGTLAGVVMRFVVV